MDGRAGLDAGAHGRQPTPSASVSIARTRLFVVDVDRKKRIDDSIDYFGNGGMRRVVVIADPCGESLLDALLDSDGAP
jgi:hypothetical protein